MIRINLLATERRAEQKKWAVAPGALQAYLFLALFGGGAVLLAAGLWWMKSSAIAELDGQIAQAEQRQKQLQAIKKQVEQFEAQKRLLEQKVKVIEDLRTQQTDAVHLLDELSKALPDFVWLTQMQQTGNSLRLQGQSNSISAVADFMSNLQGSGWFPSVDLERTQEQRNVVTFQLNVTFQNADAKAKAEAAAAAASQAGQKPAAPPAGKS
jgi:type IV pilus assembly protein PilN